MWIYILYGTWALSNFILAGIMWQLNCTMRDLSDVIDDFSDDISSRNTNQ